MIWQKAEKPKADTPKWEHVEEREDGNSPDGFCCLCNEIDNAYEKYKDLKVYFGNFYNMHADRKVAEYLFAMSEMQKCMGELASISCDIFMQDDVDPRKMEKLMGRMLFYMEVAMMSHGKDLTDARDECLDICEAIKRLE